MNYPNQTDWTEPSVLVVNVRTSTFPGYSTARLSPRVTTTSGYTDPLADCTVEVRNLGQNNVVFRFVETDNDISGPRLNLGPAISVCAGGRNELTFTPHRRWVEVKGISGESQILCEISTKINWDVDWFAQRYETTVYPTPFWQDVNASNFVYPVPTASQVFTSNTTWTVVHNLGYVATPTLMNSAGVDITSLGTISGQTANGYTVTFGSVQAGTAYSTP
jgi:hypothetical protein